MAWGPIGPFLIINCKLLMEFVPSGQVDACGGDGWEPDSQTMQSCNHASMQYHPPSPQSPNTPLPQITPSPPLTHPTHLTYPNRLPWLKNFCL